MLSVMLTFRLHNAYFNFGYNYTSFDHLQRLGACLFNRRFEYLECNFRSVMKFG